MEKSYAMKPCPFCGCSINLRLMPYGEGVYMPDGWHDEECPLFAARLNNTDDDDNYVTPERAAERWNRRYKEP